MDVLKPSTALLCKLGSIIVHADELTSPTGHHFDREALRALLTEKEVAQWIEGMSKLALVPLKRELP